MPERRRFARTRYKVDVTLRYGTVTLFGSTQDISLKGLYVSELPEKDLPLYKAINLTLQLQGLRLKLRGKIVRKDETGVGIEFDAMEFDSFLQLKNIVSLMIGDENQVTSEFVNHVTNHR